jgi:hypothetical protein
MIRYVIAPLIAAVSACTTIETPPPQPGSGSGPGPGTNVNPLGNWSPTLSFSHTNNCVDVPVLHQTITVTKASNGVDFVVAAHGEGFGPVPPSASGRIECSEMSCSLSAQFTWSDANGSFEELSDLTLESNDSVTGSGSYVNFAGCTWSYTATGTKN